ASDGFVAINDLENFSGDVKYTCKTICTVGRSNRHVHKKSVETTSWYPLDTGLFLTNEHQFNGIIYNHHMSPIATKHCLVAVANQSSELKLVDLKSGSASHLLKGHRKSVMCVRWSNKDEFILASGSKDNRCLIWDIRKAKGAMLSLDQYNGEEASEYEGGNTAHTGNVNGLHFTSDGLHLVTFGTDNCIRLWNISTGRNTLVNYGKVDNDSRRTVEFSVSTNGLPDLIYMPSGSDIEVFDIFQGSKIDTFRGHYTQVNCCTFHPHFQELYSGGNDRNILVWVPDTDTAYEEYLLSKDKPEEDDSNITRNPVTVDTWSSDEDDG
ncbi:hypothetical protein KUTeg_016102, partial [Tegillarca granosa]